VNVGLVQVLIGQQVDNVKQLGMCGLKPGLYLL
jgi:hypothetical protein